MSNAATSNKRPRILIAMANWFSSRTCRRKHGFPREMPFDTWFKARSEKYNSIFTVFKCFSGPNVLCFVWLTMHRCATRFQFMGAHFTNMVAFCKYGSFLQIWKQRRLVTAPLNFIPTWGNKCREGSNTAQILYIDTQILLSVHCVSVTEKYFACQFAWTRRGEIVFANSSRILAGNTTIQFQAKSLDTSFEKKYCAAVRYFFPCSTFTNRRNYNRQNKNNFIKPNKLEGFKKN